jgi:hypothetical protein
MSPQLGQREQPIRRRVVGEADRLEHFDGGKVARVDAGPDKTATLAGDRPHEGLCQSHVGPRIREGASDADRQQFAMITTPGTLMSTVAPGTKGHIS